MAESSAPKQSRREEFLTARQLAEILQISQSTVHRLARRGVIPSIEVTPRIRRFSLRAVRHALDSSKGLARKEYDREDNPQLALPDIN